VALDANDFAHLYDRHARELLSFLVRGSCDPDVGVDLLGETFAQAFEDRQQFRGPGPDAARAWLFTIARHQLSDYFRRGRAERTALARLGVERRELTDAEYDRIEELAALGDLRALVSTGVDRLNLQQREILRLRVIEERSYVDVAHTLGITEQAARARTSRALRALRAHSNPPDLSEATYG